VQLVGSRALTTRSDLSGNQLSMFRDIIFFDLQSDGGFGGTGRPCGAVNLLTL
jgi:hypothetical protein